MGSNQFKIRADKKRWNKVRKILPDVPTDRDRLNFVLDTSLVTAEIKLEEINFKDRLGRFLYGKYWKKR